MKPSVLVIEDDAPSNYLFEVLLAGEGFEVRSESNGGDGLEALAKRKPDLIVLDYELPDMNACVFLSAAREHFAGPAIPTLLVTANASIGDRCREIFDDFGVMTVEKPVNTDRLLLEVHKILERLD